VLVEEAPRGHRGAVAQPQVLLHRLAPEIEHAVLKAHRLGEIFLIELKRRAVARIAVIAEWPRHQRS